MPGNQGLLNRINFLGGYKMSAYGFVQARQFAYHGERFVCIGGTDGRIEHRGGGGGSPSGRSSADRPWPKWPCPIQEPRQAPESRQRRRDAMGKSHDFGSWRWIARHGRDR